MTGDENVQAGRVTSADLQPVQGRQRNLHRGESLDRRQPGAASEEVAHRPGRPQPVAGDRPDRVLEPHERRVHRFDVVVPILGGLCVHSRIQVGTGSGEQLCTRLEPGKARIICDQRNAACDSSQLGVDSFEPAGDAGEPARIHRRYAMGQRREGRERRVELSSEACKRRHRAICATA